MTDRNAMLSPEGTRRRAAIIELAGQALEERSRRRRTRRAVGAALTLACATLALVLVRAGALAPTRAPVVVAHNPTEIVPFKEAKVEIMNDADLARELKAAGIDAGVASFNGEIHLIASDGKRYEPPLRWNAPHSSTPSG